MKRYIQLFTVAMLVSCTGNNNSGPMEMVIGTYGHNLYEVTFTSDGTFGPMTAIPSENPSFVIKDGKGHYFAVSENDPCSGVYS